MSFVVLINVLSVFISISFFLELFFISKIDLWKKEKFNMKLIIILCGVATLFVTTGRLMWGEYYIYEAVISLATGGILAIWFIIVLCAYNYCVEKLKWKRDIKEDKKDYFKHI